MSTMLGREPIFPQARLQDGGWCFAYRGALGWWIPGAVGPGVGMQGFTPQAR